MARLVCADSTRTTILDALTPLEEERFKRVFRRVGLGHPAPFNAAQEAAAPGDTVAWWVWDDQRIPLDVRLAIKAGTAGQPWYNRLEFVEVNPPSGQTARRWDFTVLENLAT